MCFTVSRIGELVAEVFNVAHIQEGYMFIKDGQFCSDLPEP
jgi:hypothetical protein